MRFPLAALSFLAAAGAHAQEAPRFDAQRLTCAAAQAAVAQSSAAIVSSGPLIYDRYVASRAWCPPGDATKPGYVTTRDAAACLVGALCVTPETQRIFPD